MLFVTKKFAIFSSINIRTVIQLKKNNIFTNVRHKRTHIELPPDLKNKLY